MDKRFTELTDPSQPPLGISPAGSILWCTGKDSNLRTSLGGTDLQSVGFNHSPTCAKTLGRCGHCAPSGKLRYWGRSKAQTRKPRPNAAHFTLYFRNTGTPRLAQEDAAKITAHRKSTEWSALEKPVAPLPSPPPAGKYVSWSWRRDLNPRPSDYKSDALPTELRQQIREKDVLSPKPIPLIIARCPGQLFKVSQRELRAQAGYAIAFSNKTVGRSRLNLTSARPRYPPNPPQMLSFHP